MQRDEIKIDIVVFYGLDIDWHFDYYIITIIYIYAYKCTVGYVICTVCPYACIISMDLLLWHNNNNINSD
jgi:hypothetical protein